MSRKNIDTTLKDSFLERIKKPGCPSVKKVGGVAAGALLAGR